MATKLIVNADDFGAAGSINSAVTKARQAGVLTCASMMVAGNAVDEAVEIAKNDPGLAVGLHLTLSRGRSVLPRSEIPDLVDENSCFASDPAKAAFKYYVSAAARAQLRREIEAQFDAFAATGLTLSHVDGHQHLHAHPSVLPVVIELAAKHGASGIRIPHDPFFANLREDRSSAFYKLIVCLGHAYLASVCRRQLRDSGFSHCEQVIGSLMSGRMSSDYVMGILQRVNAESVEVFFHPADVPESAGALDTLGPNRGDLMALTDPALKRFIEDRGYELTNYAGLRGEEKRGRS